MGLAGVNRDFANRGSSQAESNPEAEALQVYVIGYIHIDEPCLGFLPHPIPVVGEKLVVGVGPFDEDDRSRTVFGEVEATIIMGRERVLYIALGYVVNRRDDGTRDGPSPRHSVGSRARDGHLPDGRITGVEGPEILPVLRLPLLQ